MLTPPALNSYVFPACSVLGKLGLYVKYGEVNPPPETVYVSVCCNRRREALTCAGAAASACSCNWKSGQYPLMQMAVMGGGDGGGGVGGGGGLGGGGGGGRGGGGEGGGGSGGGGEGGGGVGGGEGGDDGGGDMGHG